MGWVSASIHGRSTSMTPISPGLGWLASDKVSLSPRVCYEYRSQSCLKCSSCPLLHSVEQDRRGLLLLPHPETTGWTMRL